MASSLRYSWTLLSKVPEITLGFWIIKIFSTTVGETVADFLAVWVWFWQILTSTIMMSLLIIMLTVQIRKKLYSPAIYWICVVLVSIVGTQITDILTDKLGISLYTSTSIFSVILAIVFFIWYRQEQTLSIHAINTRKRELFYWWAILCAFALGTATGDLATEALSLGFSIGALSFWILIALSYVTWRLGGNAVLTFWIGYILTRPFWAALGDLFTQAREYGGLWIGAMWTSIIFLTTIVILVSYSQVTYNSPQKKQ